MDITITFADEDAKALEIALANRPQFATLAEFLQAHCQGAIDCGKYERRQRVIEALEAAEGADKIALDTLVEAIAVKVEAARKGEDATVIDAAVPSGIGEPQVIR